jgi:2-(1,2-epoxy-1,2-dihydrophenyl)acetyl-CoA isomerase
MTYRTIRLEINDARARLTLDRPERLNAFTVEMHEEVREALARVAAERAVRVLILSGAGRAFCAGQDLTDRAAGAAGGAIDLGHSLERYYGPLVLALRSLSVPVVAAVNGVAAGAGANIALACDIVVAARSAFFIQSFARLGLIPDCGGTWLLPHLAGSARALGLALLGERLGAQQAAEWGLIWRCVEDSELSAVIEDLAQRLVEAAPAAVARTKQAIHGAGSRTLEQQLEVERDMQRELGGTADFAEGVAAFLQKRPPRFTGH